MRRLGLACLGLVAASLAVPRATEAVPVAAQGVTDRTPNLSGGWVGSPGAAHFNFLHRFWLAGPDDKVVNSPSMLLAVPLPGRLMTGVRYSTNSLVAPGSFNEWEVLGRWAPPLPDGMPVDVAVGGAYNFAAESADGELSLALPLPRLRLLASARALTDVSGSGEAGWGGAAGAVLRVSDGVALAADVGSLQVDGEWLTAAWGAALQLRIPTTPHTLSLQVANTGTGSLHGSSVRDRKRDGKPLWGFEFTIPITFARYAPWLRGGGGGSPDTAAETGVERAGAGGTTVVTMTSDLRFAPDTIRIQAGDTVVWRNTTPLVHTVTADPDRVPDPEQVRLPEGAEPFDSGDMFEGAEFRHVFTEPGEYMYVCVPHAPVNMMGWVFVEPRGGSPP